MNEQESIAYLEKVLAPKEIRHKAGDIETISPAFVGPLKRKDLERVLAVMKETKAEAST